MGAPLVYGHPDTWDGFWYVVLAEQFRGDLVDPFGDLGRKVADLVKVAGDQLGVLAVAVPGGVPAGGLAPPPVRPAHRTWLARHLLVRRLVHERRDRPLLPGAGAHRDRLARRRGRAPRGCPRARRGRAGAAWGRASSRASWPSRSLLPAALAAPATASRVDMSHDTRATDWSRWALAAMGTDAVIVSWWSFSTPLWYRTVVLGERPDVQVVDDRDRLDEEPGQRGRCHPGERRGAAGLPRAPPRRDRALEETWILEIVPDPGGIQPLYRVIGPRPAG